MAVARCSKGDEFSQLFREHNGRYDCDWKFKKSNLLPRKLSREP